MRLDQNSVCLVTGGVLGLGRACVDSFLEKKCQIIIADYNEEKGKELQNYHPDQIVFIKTDVSKEDEIIRLLKQILTRFNKIDVIVNSAGVLSSDYIATTIKTLNNKEFDRVFDINVIGTFNIIKNLVKLLNPSISNQERTVIINVASLAAFESLKQSTIYAASKGSIAQITQPLAKELKQYGIRLITIAPSVFITPMGKGINRNLQIKDLFEKSVALGRLGKATEFAQLVTGVCMAEGITGEIIRIDGASRFPNL